MAQPKCSGTGQSSGTRDGFLQNRYISASATGSGICPKEPVDAGKSQGISLTVKDLPGSLENAWQI